MHKLIHIDDKTLKCCMCASTFAKKYRLKKHGLVHTGVFNDGHFFKFYFNFLVNVNKSRSRVHATVYQNTIM